MIIKTLFREMLGTIQSVLTPQYNQVNGYSIEEETPLNRAERLLKKAEMIIRKFANISDKKLNMLYELELANRKETFTENSLEYITLRDQTPQQWKDEQLVWAYSRQELSQNRISNLTSVTYQIHPAKNKV